MLGVRGIAAVTAIALLAYFLRRWNYGKLAQTLIAGGLGIAAIAAGLWFLTLKFGLTMPKPMLDLTKAYRQATLPTNAEWFLLGFAIGMFVVDTLLGAFRGIVAWLKRLKKGAAAPATAGA